MLARALVSGLLAATVMAVAACRAPTTTGPRPGATLKPATKASGKPSTAPGPVDPGVTRLTGKVKLIADARTGLAGLISDQGASLISDGGGGIISDQASGIISNNSGGIVSNNAGALISDAGGNAVSNNGARYRMQAAAGLATFALADATVTFTDAAGNPARDAAGNPLSATTDAQGGFALQADLPPGNLVARVALKGGGELLALVVPDASGAATLDLDTASTLGAAYVLGRYVKGDQRVLDRLPRPEADRLRTELDAVRRYLGAAPRYREAELVAATEALRTREAPIDRAIEDVKALLLGQAQLGNGRKGPEVPLAGPVGLTMDADGALLIGEAFIGRIRSLAADGTITALVDAGAGKIRTNFLRINDVARAKDGTLYVATATSGLYRVTPDGVAAAYLTDLAVGAGPASVAVGPDGTFYVGEDAKWGRAVPRVVAVAPDGTRSTLAIDATWGDGRVAGMGFAPDGALVLAFEHKGAAAVYRHQGGATTKIATLPAGDGASDLAVGPDGRILVAQAARSRVVAIGADGTATPVAGAGGPAATAGLKRPGSLAVGPDGTVYVADGATSLVHALRPDGRFEVAAGSEALTESGDTAAFAINQPAGLAFDDAGVLYVAESGSSRVRRYAGGKLEVVAGGEVGSGGDGGPAVDAKLDAPTGLAFRDGALWIGEANGRRIRKVGPDGIITTVAGSGDGSTAWAPGTTFAVGGKPFPGVGALALDASGRVAFTTGTTTHQLARFTPGADGGQVHVLAGQPRFDGPDVYSPTGYLENDETDPKGVLGLPNGLAFGPDGAIYFAEMVPCRVMRLVGDGGAGPLRLERVAGRPVAEMLATASEEGVDHAPDGVKATASHLAFPTAVAFDKAGNMYVAEGGTIHIGSLGAVATAEASGLSFGQLAVSALGLPRIAGRVRKIAPDGTITTVAGRGSRFFRADSGDDALVLPMALAIAPDGRMAIADLGANMVRVLPAGSY